jgi:release factor glutamine methyltransferase
LLRHCAALLTESGIERPYALQQAAWLTEFGLGVSRVELETQPLVAVTLEQWERVLALCVRRAMREPLQYILGDQEFCGLMFAIQAGVLIPRPETEVLVGEVLNYLRYDANYLRCDAQASPVVVDIGTGSGCIAIALAYSVPHAVVYATDLSLQALSL